MASKEQQPNYTRFTKMQTERQKEQEEKKKELEKHRDKHAPWRPNSTHAVLSSRNKNQPAAKVLTGQSRFNADTTATLLRRAVNLQKLRLIQEKRKNNKVWRPSGSPNKKEKYFTPDPPLSSSPPLPDEVIEAIMSGKFNAAQSASGSDEVSGETAAEEAETFNLEDVTTDTGTMEQGEEETVEGEEGETVEGEEEETVEGEEGETAEGDTAEGEEGETVEAEEGETVEGESEEVAEEGEAEEAEEETAEGKTAETAETEGETAAVGDEELELEEAEGAAEEPGTTTLLGESGEFSLSTGTATGNSDSDAA
eukprot:TRINITY_DN3376_c0_g1_i2.p1 TRINITY_DN3376_c0_g1~~TRINITY_DN3376_c0_g1_i2.p1  ORF type:complete len:311 (+),score=95.03 TRINITY_DN3376_c0_g1_i2:727-1659(+)